jgi:hypothetical protein
VLGREVTASVRGTCAVDCHLRRDDRRGAAELSSKTTVSATRRDMARFALHRLLCDDFGPAGEVDVLVGIA